MYPVVDSSWKGSLDLWDTCLCSGKIESWMLVVLYRRLSQTAFCRKGALSVYAVDVGYNQLDYSA